MRARGLTILLALTWVASACAAPSSPARSPAAGADSSSQPPSSGPKRITAAILADPFTVNAHLNSAGGDTAPGIPEVEQLVHAGFAIATDTGLRPQLAEAVPTTENGGWRVFPDGRMETRWRIRSDARWHDGTPFTAPDLLFTLQVVQDGELAALRHRTYELIERAEAPDDRTLVVTWKSTFIRADTLFSGTGDRLMLPVPRHLLERAFLADKAGFLALPFWSEGFVGAGPFKMRSWVRESHMVLEAYDQYVFGRPKLDEIEIRFIPDPNTMIANVLAGAVELTVGRGLSLEQAVAVADQWNAGRLRTAPARWVVLFPQLLTPSPAIVGDPRFRRAMLHAIDRQFMADTFQRGLASVAHSIIDPGQPLYKEVERRVVQYEYDPRRAAQILEGLGYGKGADGLFRDGAGQLLTIEARTPNVGPNEIMNLAPVDYWKALGVAVDILVIPRQRLGDNEYRWTFPSFELTKRPHDIRSLATYHSSQTPLPETRWLGSNVPRYMNPEFDALLDRYFATVPQGERTQILGEIVHHISDRLIVLGLFYDPDISLVGNRLVNVTGAPNLEAVPTWNGDRWDVTGG